MRLTSRTAQLCHEYLHKTLAPSCFDLSDRILDDPLPTALKLAGIKYENKLIESFEEINLGITYIHDFLADSRKEEETLKALNNPEARIIYGGYLSSTTRVSKPDLLVRVGETEWRPVDIKSHGASKESASNQLSVTTIPELDPEQGEKVGATLVKKDAHQLAHYIRQLQELGFCDGTPWAGIIGTDPTKIFWADLNSLTYGRGRSASGILTIYETDSIKALAIASAAIAREEDHSLAPVTIPRRISGDFGCATCEMRKICFKEMKAFDNGNGHVTLLSEITAGKADQYLGGIESIKELASADNLPPQGMAAVTRANVWLTKKPERMDPSRDFKVPEFDIEIDIDLENSQEAIREAGIEDSVGRDAVYLYGYGIHERHKNPDWRSSTFGYFDNYADTDEAEFNVLNQMWQFLQEQVKSAEAQGKTIGIFHYSTHELTWWKNFAERHATKPGAPTRQAKDDFVSKYFVDLLPLAKELAFPVTGYSIKALAPLAGFNWRVDDAGGGNSIVYYQNATSRENSELDRNTAIAWLRSYNEDDVRATMAVREYLSSIAIKL